MFLFLMSLYNIYRYYRVHLTWRTKQWEMPCCLWVMCSWLMLTQQWINLPWARLLIYACFCSLVCYFISLSENYPILLFSFTGKMFYIKAFVWYLYFVFKNKSRIYCATFYRKTFLGEGKWLPRILQSASFNLT